MSEATVRKVMDLFNRHDAAGFAAAYASDAVAYDPQYPEPLRGRDAIRRDMEEFFNAFSDVTGTVERVLEKGDLVAFDATMKGTNTGRLKLPDGTELPATNKPIALRAAIFCRLNSRGEIEEERRYMDLTSLTAQLGIATQAQP